MPAEAARANVARAQGETTPPILHRSDRAARSGGQVGVTRRLARLLESSWPAAGANSRTPTESCSLRWLDFQVGFSPMHFALPVGGGCFLLHPCGGLRNQVDPVLFYCWAKCPRGIKYINSTSFRVFIMDSPKVLVEILEWHAGCKPRANVLCAVRA